MPVNFVLFITYCRLQPKHDERTVGIPFRATATDGTFCRIPLPPKTERNPLLTMLMQWQLQVYGISNAGELRFVYNLLPATAKTRRRMN